MITGMKIGSDPECTVNYAHSTESIPTKSTNRKKEPHLHCYKG